MTVRATGRVRGEVFLNSEDDYRDQRNLSIVISPAIAEELAVRFAQAPEGYLQGRRIAVRVTARRVKIHFISNGRVTEKYYYQTHVVLNAARHLTVAGEERPLSVAPDRAPLRQS